MFHWSPTLIDFSDTEDCDSRRILESSQCTVFDQQQGSGWMDEKRRQALYIPSLQPDQEIFDYTLEDIAMPSVSILEEQEFEKTIQQKDHNSNILFELTDTANMDALLLESKDIVLSSPVCAIDQPSGKEATPVKHKRRRCDTFQRDEEHNAFSLETSQRTQGSCFPASCNLTPVLGLVSSSTVDNSTASADTHFLDHDIDLCPPSVSPTDHFSNKENVGVVKSEAEDAYDMQNLRDSLPKLKVMTPAHLHNEISGAFTSYSEMEASTSAWPVLSSHDSLDSVGTATGDSEHDTSFCSVDSTMTVSSVESLPKMFYDPDLHRGHHLTAVSVPPLRRSLSLAAPDFSRTIVSSRASYNRDSPRLNESKINSNSYFRNGAVGFSTAPRLNSPVPSSLCATSFSTSSKSRFARRPEPTLSKAMVKLVFPSPTKSSSSLNGFAVGSQRTDGFMELYSQTYGKRIRSLRTPSTVDDCVDSKRRCQRSTTPQISNVKTDSHSEPKHATSKKDKPRQQMSVSLSATAPRKHASSVPRAHRLGISGPKPVLSQMSGHSSELGSGQSFAYVANHHRNLFLHEAKRHALASRDNSHDVSQNVALSGQDVDSTGAGDLELGCRAKKRPHLSPGRVVNKRALLLSPPLAKRNPLLQKFFDNIPAVTATNVMLFSDDQMEAVTLKNTLLNRDQSHKMSKTSVETQQTTFARPPSRLKWRTDLVTVVTEGSKVPTTTATTKKSILSVRTYVVEASSVP